MQIILKEDVPSLGKAGEVVRVANGYGRNFLFPFKKAIPATPGNLKLLEQQIKAIEAKREKKKGEAQALGEKIASTVVTLAKQAGEEDKIFGSVSSREIAQSLKSQGIEIDARLIRLKTPIRTAGEHGVEVHLHGDVMIPLKVIVVKK